MKSTLVFLLFCGTAAIANEPPPNTPKEKTVPPACPMLDGPAEWVAKSHRKWREAFPGVHECTKPDGTIYTIYGW